MTETCSFISLWLGSDHSSVYDWDLFIYQCMTGTCWFISLWLGSDHSSVYDWDLFIYQSMTGTCSFISLWLGSDHSSVYDWDLLIYQFMTGTWSFITVWTVVQTVLTATFNSYGNRQISTPYKISTPEPIGKNSAQLITSARGPPIPNLVQIHPLRASRQMGEI